MKTGAAATLFICGTVCMVVPWAYSAYHNHVVAGILGRPGVSSVELFNESTTALKWLTVLIGLGMIVVGIIGSLRHRAPKAAE